MRSYQNLSLISYKKKFLNFSSQKCCGLQFTNPVGDNIWGEFRCPTNNSQIFFFFPYCELFWKLYRETYLRDRWAIRERDALSTFSLNAQIFC